MRNLLRNLSRNLLAVVLLLIAPAAVDAAAAPAAAQVDQTGNGKETSIAVVVDLGANALRVAREVVPGQQQKTEIAHLDLEPLEDEPVFHTDRIGFPKLPFVTRFVALPPGAEVTGIEVKALEATVIPEVPLVGWAQPLQAGQQFGQDPQNRYAELPERTLDEKQRPVWYPADFVPLAASVMKLKSYPETLVTTSTAYPRGKNWIALLRLDIVPMQWEIQSAQLVYAPRLQITVRFAGGGRLPPTKTAAELAMLEDILELVVNREAIPAPPEARRGPETAPYLIITDDHYWTSDFQRTPGANLVSAFEVFARWKKEKGVNASVIRIADIVDGRYGDFRTGAHDLQETIRNFLKFAERNYDTRWVLLGGDVEIIPPRKVVAWAAANAAHAILRRDDSRPRPGRGYWDAAEGRVRINTAVRDFTHIISGRTGKSFRQVSDPGPERPGWTFVRAGRCDMTGAPAGSRCIEVGGSRSDLEFADMALVMPENLIPTDLYYSSLVGDEYDIPGRKDWDLNGDGLYGTNKLWGSADGVSYFATVALGRAPVSTAEEAINWIRKTIEYERTGLGPAEKTRRVLLAADNWGGAPHVVRTTEAEPPPGTFREPAAGDTEVTLHLNGTPGSGADWRLVGWRNASSWSVFRYNRHPTPTAPGYYYCRTLECTERSEFALSPWTSLPVPTQFVKVVGLAEDIVANSYYFDSTEPDGAMLEKEAVKRILERRFPRIDQRKRLYQDIFDITPASDLSRLRPMPMDEAVLSGYNLVSLSGHGWWDGCCGLSARRVRVWPAGVGSDSSGVVYADSCLTNEFDVPEEDALSETLLTRERVGAVAYVGNTRFSWIGLGAQIERAFWRRLGTTRHLGRLHNVKQYYAWRANEQWVSFSLNLMGDPELSVWRGTPSEMRFTDFPYSLTLGDRIEFRITDWTTRAPVPLATVVITDDDGTFEVQRTDGDGRVSFRPVGRDRRRLRVTATHPLLDYRAASSTIWVERR